MEVLGQMATPLRESTIFKERSPLVSHWVYPL